jgi:hypothetical protein
LGSDANLAVYNNGTAYWSSQGGTISDRRMKTAIAPTLASGLGMVNALEVVDYQWKVETPMADNGKTHTGFIAQDVSALIADAGSEVGGTFMLNKPEIIPYLVKALQELHAEVQALRAQVGPAA